MNDVVKIKLSEFLGTPYCVATEDGQKIYAELHRLIINKQQVRLSFEGVTRVTTAFLNAAIGQLYGEHSDADIKRQVRIEEVAPSVEPRLASVISNSKKFFEEGHRPSNTLSEQ